MIIARISFKPEFAPQFCEGKNQTIVETTFQTGYDMAVTMKEFDPYIEDCVAIVTDGTRIAIIRKTPAG